MRMPLAPPRSPAGSPRPVLSSPPPTPPLYPSPPPTLIRGSYESEDLWQTAGALAACAPWAVSLDDVHVQLLAGAADPHHLGRILNGALVGLLEAPPPPSGTAHGPDGPPASAYPYPPGGVSCACARLDQPPLLPCLGMGLVRAVDMATRTAYVLADVGGGEQGLGRVGVLSVGRLELPGGLLVGGEVASPYQQLFSLAADAAAGAGAVKSRKNLARASHQQQQ